MNFIKANKYPIIGATGILSSYLVYKKMFNNSANELSLDKFNKLELINKEKVTNNTNMYEFKFKNQSEKIKFDLINSIQFKDNSMQIIRYYTPLPNDTCKWTKTGFECDKLTFLIKHYQNGPLSTLLEGLKVGGNVEMRGPYATYDYQPSRYDKVGCIVGGTGITPIYQLLVHSLKDEKDKTKFNILYLNSTHDDILLKKELNKLQAEHSNRLSIQYQVTNELPKLINNGEAQDTEIIYGKFTSTTFNEWLREVYQVNQSNYFLVCGPDGFVKSVSGERLSEYNQGPIDGWLGRLGFGQNEVFKL
jgi:cytochrome-b5 reductase